MPRRKRLSPAPQSDDNRKSEDGDELPPNSPSSRLSGIKRPKVGTDRKYAVYQSKTAKGKGTKKGRNFGKLFLLMNMPLDILFEITSRLEPLDILQLSRVSKHFRTTFACRGSRHIWIAARKNIPGLPDCPQDLSEPQFASLMFEHNCHACGKPRALKTDYSLRVRFCSACYKENVKKGSVIAEPYRIVPEDVPKVVFTLLPRSLLTLGLSDTETFEANTNKKHDYFYVPELEMVIQQWQRLESGSKALELFEKQQSALASEIMQHAMVLLDWVAATKDAKFDEDYQRHLNRESSITAKLVDLGYNPSDFPIEHNYQWSALVGQPRELTPRIWKVIRPKLEALIAEEKARRLEAAKQERLIAREDEFELFWEFFLDNVPSVLGKDLIPTIGDAYELATVVDMLADDDAHATITQERFLARK